MIFKQITFEYWDSKELDLRVTLRVEQLIEHHEETNPDTNILVVVIYCGIGRSVGHTLGESPRLDRSHILLMNLLEFEAISSSEETDVLSLWKYSTVFERTRRRMELQMTSLLDGYALFLKKDGSFYASDDAINVLSIAPGMGRELRMAAHARWRRHCVSNGRGHLEEVVCRYDGDIPIYVPQSDLGLSLRQVVEGYDFPIRVSMVDLNHRTRQEYAEILDAVSYWLWQITPTLRSPTSALGVEAVHLFVRIEESKEVVDSVPAVNHPPEFPVRSHAASRTVELTFPAQLQPWLLRADNMADQALVRGLVEGLMTLQSSASDVERIRTIQGEAVDRHAPLGIKKKFFAVDASRMLQLAPWDLVRVRKLQAADVSMELESLAQVVRKRVPALANAKNGDIDPSLNKDTLGAIRSHLLVRLREVTHELAWSDACEYFWRQLDSLVHDVEFQELTGPTSAACFRDIPSQALEIAGTMPRLNRTALSLRFVLEFLAAERPQGTRQISAWRADQIVAIAHQFANWGLLGEELRCRVADVKLSLLASDRVGVEVKAEYRTRTQSS